MLKEGDKAPGFTLKNEENQDIILSNFNGKKVVIYFYPKDDTPGCTKEACSFRDLYDDILDAGAVVIGISADNSTSHQKFKDKHTLPFYLLTDADHSVIESYGAWQEKKMFGKTYMGIVRSTFIIDENGTIIKTYQKVKPEEHGEEVLKVLKNQ
ncbi:thioredoxin-dependent thiol peroxidase [Clostridium tagluense]|uniref:thioredoxin-dependent thiol peroxidase n=1 Tax=Clostridium tagluense TaxID=360422 RepID=UPI001C0CEB39|nr:thioredoxin-dependent thiol peroxidase [Clostridium tagluense]MBU3126326.1 thioredoxin-dependent thiol peroxidase [Clostridium tagluense]MCB2309693.1 thioredoxin-dependent thiol peroxidase [Clostridium tagluense]MCB2314777.1 thioredoxin-dependent thiol peroxidase [Clostridium tagluense]MCB2319626.1 thioredoxin-dependent thiol peroxidase [Clostridium tagluense]MCB2324287.1 thioredoxin-dependent thiol peroxidase [Clostridium tagluense]